MHDAISLFVRHAVTAAQDAAPASQRAVDAGFDDIATLLILFFVVLLFSR